MVKSHHAVVFTITFKSVYLPVEVHHGQVYRKAALGYTNTGIGWHSGKATPCKKIK